MENSDRVPDNGNRWIASNQCTDVNGCMANSSDPACTACDAQTICHEINYPPPPTGLGLSSGVLRNFSMQGDAARLYVGATCPPACTGTPVPPCLFNAPVVEGNPLFPICP